MGRVMVHFVKMFKRKHGGDLRPSNRAIAKLRREVEKAKRALSSVHQTKVEIESLYDGIDFSETLTRAKFEELCMDLFRKTLGPVKKVMDDSDLGEHESLDDIVLLDVTPLSLGIETVGGVMTTLIE